MVKNLPHIKKIVHSWWEELEDNRGDRSEIRRARSLKELIFLTCFVRLAQQLPKASPILLTAIARVVVHVTEDVGENEHFGKTLNQVNFSKLRFRRLLQQEDLNELTTHLIRTLGCCRNRANVRGLVEILVRWSCVESRLELATHYFAKTTSEPVSRPNELFHKR